MGWQLAPATTFTKQKLQFSTINIREPGFLFTYLSYDDDSDNWVFFDDFKVTHTKTNVLQYNEYYPFGLRTNSSWTRDNSKNNLLYNDAGELNELTSFYDLAFRQYDPTIGRFLQVDPLANMTASFSPYQYARNNPILLNDPMGLTDQKVLDIVTSLMSLQYGGEATMNGGGIRAYSSEQEMVDAANRYAERWGLSQAEPEYGYKWVENASVNSRTGQRGVMQRYIKGYRYQPLQEDPEWVKKIKVGTDVGFFNTKTTTLKR